MTCKKQKIYIEWAQQTGKYLYFDLLTVIKKAKNVTFNLSMFQYDDKNDECIKPSFDESVSPEKVLTNDDIVLLSPIRSFQLKYTAMGQYYNDHILYLGPLPTKQFVKQCNIKYLFNCCSYSNDEDILKLPNVKEIAFDVAGWSVGRIDDDEDDDEKDDDQD